MRITGNAHGTLYPLTVTGKTAAFYRSRAAALGITVTGQNPRIRTTSLYIWPVSYRPVLVLEFLYVTELLFTCVALIREFCYRTWKALCIHPGSVRYQGVTIHVTTTTTATTTATTTTIIM